jgi:hypothetical protein
MSKSLNVFGSPIYKGKLMYMAKLFYFVRGKSFKWYEYGGHFLCLYQKIIVPLF